MLNLCRSREASDTESQTAEGEAIKGRGENTSLHFAKKKFRRRESSVNPQTPRPHRQISAGDFFLLEKKERAPVPLEMRRSR